MTMEESGWQQVRQLFEAVCDLPQTRWREELERLSGDPALVDEAMALLTAQTVQLGRSCAPLGDLLARMAGPELDVGDRIGPWRLTRHLASGGMGSVFAAERADDLYQQQVAVKLLRGLPDAFTARQLAAERQILASLRHPNIARLYDGGTTPAGQPYLVMEYIEGATLERHLEANAPGLDARLRLFLRICQAVQAAHEHLVLHCDLKPGNVLVREDGEPMLLDFGIARLLDTVEGSERGRFCTMPYACPELLSGKQLGVTGDIFSLGVMLVELLSGRRVERSLANAGERLPPASSWALPGCAWKRRLRGDLDAIAAKACAIDPDRRYGSVAELSADLRRHLAHYPVRARRPSRAYRLHRLLRRRWREMAVAAVVLAMSSAFVWTLRGARDEARQQAETAEQVSDFLIAAFDAADPRKRETRGTEEISAREVLDNSARRLDTDLSQSPVMRARLRAVLGRAYTNLEQSKLAEPLLRRAAEELESPAVDLPREAWSALHSLSILLSNQSRATEAIAVAQHSLKLAERVDDISIISMAWNNLGVALQGADRFDEAGAALNRALALRRQMQAKGGYRNREDDESGILHNLGLLLKGKGDYAGAERYYRQALAGKRTRYGERSYEYHVTLMGLANTLAREGKLREASLMQEQGLQLARALFGEQNDAIIDAQQDLAGVYQDLGQLARSRQHYLDALEMSRRMEAEGTLDNSRLINNFATLEESRGDVAAAEALYRKSLQIRRERLGPVARASLITEANLGRLLLRNGRLDEAEPLLAHSRTELATLLDADNPDMLVQRLTLPEQWMRHGDLAQARRALAAVQPASGWPSPQLKDRRDALEAEIEHRSGNYAAALRIWRRLLDKAQARTGESAMPVARMRVSLAETLAAQGDKASAREQVRLAQPVLAAQMVPGAALLERLSKVEASMR